MSENPEGLSYDLVIRNANILGDGSLTDIGIAGGRVQKIQRALSGKGQKEIEADGCLVSPPFIDPHAHLDKAYLKPARNGSGTLEEAIRIMSQHKGESLLTSLNQRVEHALMLAVKNGTLTIRTHVDIGEDNATASLEQLLLIKEKWSPYIELQVVAFPQEGLIHQENVQVFMKAAMRLGADVVGGIPAIEGNSDSSYRHIAALFDLAAEFDRDVDMHIDETDDPASQTLEMVADVTMEAGWQGRVSAAHCCSLAGQADEYAQFVIEKVREAKMNIITNPQVNLVLQGRHDQQPVRRGITRVKELISAGVNVTCGQDNIQDAFYPFGNLDMLEVAFVTAISAQMTGDEEIQTVFDMPRYNAAKCLRIKDYGISEGTQANLIILPVRTVEEALAYKPARTAVIRNGRVISETREMVEMHFPDSDS